MGFFDSAQSALDKGVSAAKGAVSGVAVEQQAFAKRFVQLCSDGAAQGWHDGDGGSLSYRLTGEEASSCRSYFYDNPSSWVQIGAKVPALSGEYVLVTAAGAALRAVPGDLNGCAGIVEIGGAGDTWRIMWGFKDGGRPTAEFAAHCAVLGARKQAGRASRVLYIARPAQTLALAQLVPADGRSVSRALWKSYLESVAAVAQGVGVVPWDVFGGAPIAERASAELSACDVCVWAQHAVLAAADSCADAYGLLQTVEKAAAVHNAVRAAGGGAELPDDAVRAFARAYALPLNEAYLD